MRRLIIFLLLVTLVYLPAHAHVLTINVTDSSTGEHLPFRGSVTDANDTERWPLPSASCIKHDAGAGQLIYRVWWLADSPCTLSIPKGGEGTVTVRVGHGFEYSADSLALEVTADVTASIELDQLVDMNELGWWSGDSCFDIHHPTVDYTLDTDDALWALECEGMNIGFPEDNGYLFTGEPVYDADGRIIFMTEELRHYRLGHYGLLGIPALTKCAHIGVADYCENINPLIYDYANTDSLGPSGIMVAAHPSEYGPTYWESITYGATGWPRSLTADAWYGVPDAYDIDLYTSDSWLSERLQNLWSAGIRLPLTGGTDITLGQDSGPPFGWKRTYAFLGDDPFTWTGWLDAIKNGKTFATTGPIITDFTVEGKRPGETIYLNDFSETELDVSLSFVSGEWVDHVDFLVNGVRDGGDYRMSSNGETVTDVVTVENGGAWISAVVVGADPGWFTAGDSLVAITSPVWVEVNGVGPRVPAACADLVTEVENLITYTDTLGPGLCDWGVDEKARAVGLFNGAKDGYELTGKQGRVYTVGSGGDYEDLWTACNPNCEGDAPTYGAEPHSTIIVLDGVHPGPGSRALPHGSILTSLGPAHKDACQISNLNAGSACVTVDSTATIRDLTLRPWEYPIDDPDKGALTVAGAGSEAYVSNVRIVARGDEAGAAAISVRTAEKFWFINSEIDSSGCDDTGADYAVYDIRNCNRMRLQDSRFINNDSQRRSCFFVYNTVTADTTLQQRNIYRNNSNYDRAVVYGISKTDDTYRFRFCTFDGNTITNAEDVQDGQVGVDDAAGGDLVLSYCNITGGGTTYGIRSVWEPDSMNYCNIYGNGNNTGYGTQVDVISVDPEYNSVDLTRTNSFISTSRDDDGSGSSPYRTEDGYWMGWKRYFYPSSGGSGSGISLRSNRRQRGFH